MASNTQGRAKHRMGKAHNRANRRVEQDEAEANDWEALMCLGCQSHKKTAHHRGSSWASTFVALQGRPMFHMLVSCGTACGNANQLKLRFLSND